jgi:hypothetical protein
MPGSVSPKLKRTFYLDRESFVELSELQVKEFRLTGRKPDFSELVSRGIILAQRRALLPSALVDAVYGRGNDHVAAVDALHLQEPFGYRSRP